MHKAIAEAVAKDLEMQGEWLSVEDYAARLRVSEATVRHACQRGELTCQRVGRQWRVWFVVPTATPATELTARVHEDARQMDLNALEAVVSFARAALEAGARAAQEETNRAAQDGVDGKPVKPILPNRAFSLGVVEHVRNTVAQYDVMRCASCGASPFDLHKPGCEATPEVNALNALLAARRAK